MWEWLVFPVAIRDGEALSSEWNQYANNNWTTLGKFLSYLRNKNTCYLMDFIERDTFSQSNGTFSLEIGEKDKKL